MSLCRWSSNNFGCDLYCYHGDDGLFVTHVASWRYAGDIPRVDFSASPEDMAAQMQAQQRFLETAELLPIGGPCDGVTFCDPDEAALIRRLTMLRGSGYRFPAEVIDVLQEEMAGAA